MPALTRGPLPARVYWVRRVLVLGTAVLLVFAVGRLLVGGSDGSDGAGSNADDRASRVAARTSPSLTPGVTGTAPTSALTPALTPTPSATPTPTLAAPSGACRSSDIAVTPTVAKAVAGQDVTIAFELRTLTAAACTWRVAPVSLSVEITSGKDHVWSSLECPRMIPRQEVVVRQAATTTVSMVWKDARRSDEDCSRRTDWARPGFYHVTAAAVGGEPADVQFELQRPGTITVTKTATPTQSPSAKVSGKASATATAKSTTKSTSKATTKPAKKHGPKASATPSGPVD